MTKIKGKLNRLIRALLFNIKKTMKMIILKMKIRIMIIMMTMIDDL